MEIEQYKKEKELLLNGYSPKEIAKILIIDHKSIIQRNYRKYNIDCQSAFENRIKKEGLPSRLQIEDAFGYWFSGWIDGEGHFGIRGWKRQNNKIGYDIQFSVKIRDDDANVIEYVKNNLKVGVICRQRTNGKNSNSKPTISLTVKKIEDLAEVIVPIFEKYPLFTKKSEEFKVWKKAVIDKYIKTLGGTSKYRNSTENCKNFEEQIDTIRKYHIRENKL